MKIKIFKTAEADNLEKRLWMKTGDDDGVVDRRRKNGDTTEWTPFENVLRSRLPETIISKMKFYLQELKI